MHAASIVHPDAEDEYHATAKSCPDLGHAALVGGGVGSAQNLLLGGAVRAVDVVLGGHAGNVDWCVRDDLSALDVETVDRGEASGIGAV